MITEEYLGNHMPSYKKIIALSQKVVEISID